MTKDYGIASIHNVHKPFVFDKVMRKGANKGKVRVWLTRGRAIDGSIIKGTRAFVHPKDIIECPPDLIIQELK
jgi:hypothetical protein